MGGKFDPSLYLVTDPELTRGRPVSEVVRAAVGGGATLVQLREKKATTRDFISRALELRKLLREADVPLIINDRVDVALATRADGVHLGADDMPYQVARELLGPDTIIGVSVQSVDEAVAASASAPDYIAASPIFATGTKPDHAPPLGLKGLREIRARVRDKLIAIGGITVENAADVIAAGADGIAVVTALTLAYDPASAARDLLNEIARGRDARV
jgi:thiamine-phosphate pyrophosphorylase